MFLFYNMVSSRNCSEDFCYKKSVHSWVSEVSDGQSIIRWQSFGHYQKQGNYFFGLDGILTNSTVTYTYCPTENRRNV